MASPPTPSPTKSLSDNLRPISNPSASEMQHPQIVLDTILLSYQQTPKPVQPRVSALNHPTPSAISGYLHTRPLLLTTTADVGRATPLQHQLPHLRIVVTLVQTDMPEDCAPWGRVCVLPSIPESLPPACCRGDWPRLRPRYGNTIALGQHRAFHFQIAAVGGVASSGLTPRAGPWSLPRPWLASPIPCLSVRHTRATHPPTATRKHSTCARADSGHAQCWEHQTLWGAPSTGSRYAERRRCRPSTYGHRSRVVRPLGAALWRAEAAQCESTTHRGYASHRQLRHRQLRHRQLRHRQLRRMSHPLLVRSVGYGFLLIMTYPNTSQIPSKLIQAHEIAQHCRPTAALTVP